MTREEAIEVIEQDIPCEHDRDLIEALDMAIASLKTDEAYQLEYENRDFVEIPKGMTNGEVIQTLFPQSYFLNDFPFCGSSLEKVYFDDKKSNLSCIMVSEEWWNAPYKTESEDKE